jgi:hypothetical protein
LACACSRCTSPVAWASGAADKHTRLMSSWALGSPGQYLRPT